MNSVPILAFICLFGNIFGQAASPSQTSSALPVKDSPSTITATGSPGTPAVTRQRFVPVLISVIDHKGKPVAELTKEQLKIEDNDQLAQPLQIWKAADVPLHLGIVLLASPATFGRQQAAVTDLVQQIIRPNVDEAFVVAAKGKKAWPSERLDWKSDPAELTKIIHGLDRDAGLPDAFNFELKTDEVGGDENAGRDTVQYYAAGGVSVFDAAYAMMNSDPRPARRVLVMFRDPWAHSPGFGLRVNQSVEGQMQRVIAVAQAMHVTLFVIGLEDARFSGANDNNFGKIYTSVHAGDDGGAGEETREYDRQMERNRMSAYNQGRTNVERLATETGGETFWSTKRNYSDAVTDIANRIAGQYLVTFTPVDVTSPTHHLRITAEGGSRVLAQTAFFAGPTK